MDSSAILQIKVGNYAPRAYVALQSQPPLMMDTFTPPIDRLKGLNGVRKYGKTSSGPNSASVRKRRRRTSKPTKPRPHEYRPGSSGRVTPSRRRNTLTGNTVYSYNPLLQPMNFQNMSAPMINDVHNMLRANTAAQVSAAPTRAPRRRRVNNQVVDLTDPNSPAMRAIARRALRANERRYGEPRGPPILAI